MHVRVLAVVSAGILLIACSDSMSRERPGISYGVHLTEVQPMTCVDFAHDLTGRVPVRIVSEDNLRASGCIAELRNSEPSLSVIVYLVSDPINRNLSVTVEEYGKWGPVTPSITTQEFAAQVLTAIHQYFPAADVTQRKLREGLLGP
jgi:hypothetical protein